VHKYDERLRERVERAVEATAKPRLVAAFAQAFETSRDRLTEGAERGRDGAIGASYARSGIE
jgi:hypothetical protein